jgi:hypothetical protein
MRPKDRKQKQKHTMIDNNPDEADSDEMPLPLKMLLGKIKALRSDDDKCTCENCRKVNREDTVRSIAMSLMKGFFNNSAGPVEQLVKRAYATAEAFVIEGEKRMEALFPEEYAEAKAKAAAEGHKE